jgi:predicted phosphoadenosine phosphosulfate sulfurtransferase
MGGVGLGYGPARSILMKILSDKTVFTAALERVNYLFDEFPNIVVGMSGGKDSTVVFELVMRVARERGRLPQAVFFLDQEAEWIATIDYVREVMHNPDVRPLWMQMPMHLDNAASFTTRFLRCWDPDEQANWIRERDPISIKENTYGTDRFGELFAAIFGREFASKGLAVMSGVRCEESPNRLMGLTEGLTYKWITWGKKLNPGHFTFYPIYDWSYTDVWHAIHSEGWKYNRIYSYQYRYGVPVNQMRVSNLHHETAVRPCFTCRRLIRSFMSAWHDGCPGWIRLASSVSSSTPRSCRSCSGTGASIGIS